MINPCDLSTESWEIIAGKTYNNYMDQLLFVFEYSLYRQGRCFRISFHNKKWLIKKIPAATCSKKAIINSIELPKCRYQLNSEGPVPIFVLRLIKEVPFAEMKWYTYRELQNNALVRLHHPDLLHLNDELSWTGIEPKTMRSLSKRSSWFHVKRIEKP